MRLVNFILLICFLVGMAPVPFLNRSRSVPLYQMSLKQTLTASPVGNNFHYGGSQAISENGQHVLIGCYDCTVSGAANSGLVDYWKKGAGESWTRTNSFNPTALADGQFGYVLAISGDGNYAAISGQTQGRVYIYKRNNGTNIWEPTQNFQSPNYSPSIQFVNEMAFSYDGTYLVIGSPLENSGASATGRAYIYYRQPANSTYDSTPIATLPNPKPLAANRYFGYSVGISVDGTWIIVGAKSEDNVTVNTGNAYIYRRTGTTTINTTPQDLSPNTTYSSECGTTARINNIRALISCSIQPNFFAYIYNGSTWVLNTSFAEGAYIDLSNSYYSISLTSGAIKPWVDNRNTYTAGTAITLPSSPSTPEALISIDGRYVVAGTWEFDDSGFTDSGRAYIYKLE
jgi:hypothetical protein